MSAPIDNTFIRDLEMKNGEQIKIHQLEVGDVGCVVWDAALVMCRYIETGDFDGGNSWRGLDVVEVGAGTGVLGVYAAAYGANVTVTDLPEFLPLMNLNIDTNRHHITGTAVAESLKWGEESLGRTVDCVLMADCIYYDKSLGPLVETVCSLCSDKTTVFCCYEQRTTGNKPELERKFLELMLEKFDVEDIPLERQDSLFRSEDILIKRFWKKTFTEVG
ncbi:protein-lysine methyltransferase METTL21D-like isoform X1 [Pecten maximus]|uniref:protein-lysine methyltransferase METTL21D-like isoform X1 n=1 Tax=Pecten maximus TaxID=6579 RepID=UPI001458E62F|nr:protein-lysine methyltransferase METTL21D-like isoform X1 [Pecten maximus]